MDDEEKFLALLREVHRFPTAYDLRIICLTEVAEALPGLLVAATSLELVGEPTRRASSAGRYVSVSLSLLVHDAPDVVRAYRALKTFEGIKTFF